MKNVRVTLDILNSTKSTKVRSCRWDILQATNLDKYGNKEKFVDYCDITSNDIMMKFN